jgi:hypothetical protein
MNFLGLNSAKDLYSFTKDIYSSYYKKPSEEKLVLLIFLLNHLREWIVEGNKWDDIKKIPREKRSQSEIFFEDIYSLSEFKIIFAMD